MAQSKLHMTTSQVNMCSQKKLVQASQLHHSSELWHIVSVRRQLDQALKQWRTMEREKGSEDRKIKNCYITHRGDFLAHKRQCITAIMTAWTKPSWAFPASCEVSLFSIYIRLTTLDYKWQPHSW